MRETEDRKSERVIERQRATGVDLNYAPRAVLRSGVSVLHASASNWPQAYRANESVG